MGIVKAFQCDNPSCRNTGLPESLKPLRPPFGWYSLKGYCQAYSAINVTVCSVDCIKDAVLYQERDD